jgi:hypothetical protein
MERTMAKRKNRTRKEKSAISRRQETTGAARKTASRKLRAAPKVNTKVKAQAAKAAPKPESQSTGVNRSEGIRLFKVAGRPTREQFVLVYGERGPKMTWEQRAAAGVPAEKFQAALAEKAVSRPAAAKPARTTRQTATLPLAGA